MSKEIKIGDLVFARNWGFGHYWKVAGKQGEKYVLRRTIGIYEGGKFLFNREVKITRPKWRIEKIEL